MVKENEANFYDCINIFIAIGCAWLSGYLTWVYPLGAWFFGIFATFEAFSSVGALWYSTRTDNINKFQLKNGSLQELQEKLVYTLKSRDVVLDPKTGKRKTIVVLVNEKNGISVLASTDSNFPKRFTVLDEKVVTLSQPCS